VRFRVDQKQPGVTYRMAVALDRPARITMPLPMHVVGVQPTRFRAKAVFQPLPAVAQIGGPVGAMRGDLAGYPLTSTAIVGDWDEAGPVLPLSVGFGSGDACASSAPVPAAGCDNSNEVMFWGETFALEETGARPMQVVFGREYQHPIAVPYVDGYILETPRPVNATALVDFGIAPPH
jgi:hypothetical protein